MQRFKIIATPPGQAPEWVRKEWIGLELPVSASTKPGFQAGVFGSLPENLGGFAVEGRVAIDLLGEKSPKAALWWRNNAPHVLSARLVFKREVCEAI